MRVKAIENMNEKEQQMVTKALCEAWRLGQMYWQYADSNFPSDHKKAEAILAKFRDLVAQLSLLVGKTDD